MGMDSSWGIVNNIHHLFTNRFIIGHLCGLMDYENFAPRHWPTL